MSFSILNCSDILSGSGNTYMYTGNDNTLSQVMYQVINNTGNHTIAAVKAEESYPALAQDFAEVIAVINSVQEEGDIDVGGCQHLWISSLEGTTR